MSKVQHFNLECTACTNLSFKKFVTICFSIFLIIFLETYLCKMINEIGLYVTKRKNWMFGLKMRIGFANLVVFWTFFFHKLNELNLQLQNI